MEPSATLPVGTTTDQQPPADSKNLPALPATSDTWLTRYEVISIREVNTNIHALKKGEVYGILDFCCHRAPAWYRAEVDRISLLAGPPPDTLSDPINHSHFQVAWELSHAAYLDQEEEPREAKTALVTVEAKPPSRVQPPRAAKRKAAGLANSQRCIIRKRRKGGIADTIYVSTAEDAGDTHQRPYGDYHISLPMLQDSLCHLFPTQDSDPGTSSHSDLSSFRNRLTAKVTSKMMGIYARKMKAGNKPCRCALTGKETESPWCRPGKRTVEPESPAAPEPDMVPSPTLANWPPPPKTKARMAKEKIEENIVEFGGLKFLVDVCGEPPLVRVKML